MCVMCSDLTPTSPGHLPANPGSAALLESADAAGSTATGYSMSVGDTFSGSLNTTGDRDWVAITLSAGQSVDIGLTGAPSGHGTLSDPYLRVYDGSGSQLAFNDDGGRGYESQLSFTASSGGTYFIGVGAWGDRYTGTYRISVTEDVPPAVADLDTLANYLTDGYWEDNGGAGRAFDLSGSNEISVNLTGLTAAGQQLARWALEAWEMVADLAFVETAATGADITFYDPGVGDQYYNSAYSTSNVSFTGEIISSDVVIGQGWLASYGTTLDSYSFQTYIHEIGHALGLGHQGSYNGAATYGVDETFANDSWQISVMSYFSQTDNTTINASWATVMSTMMADIVAIQNLYGAAGAGSATAGATIWGTGTNLGGYFADLLDPTSGAYAGGPVAYTIFDQGGIDRIDTTGDTANQRIDLNAETYSDVDGLTGNIAIARGTVIENAFTGAGNDTITGNAADNDIRAGGGQDSLTGAAGADTLNGGAGNDTLAGGAGADLFVMSTGVDRITDFNAFDRIDLRGHSAIASYADLTASHMSQIGANVVIDGGLGSRLTLEGVSLASLDSSDFLLSAGGPVPTTGDDVLVGTAGNDNINGLAGNDNIRGLAGDDTLFGGDGHDTLSGGEGGDRLWGGDGGDSIYAGAGDDLLGGSAGWDRIFGGDGNDTLYGGTGDDRVGGGTGNDNIGGGHGNDQLWGFVGADSLFAGDGNDSLAASFGYDVLYGGDGNDVMYGGDGRDTLRGGNDNDTLWGGNDNDRLNAQAGDDRMIGGAGNDTFVYVGGADVITDFDRNGDDVIDLGGAGGITGYWDLMNNGHIAQVGGDVVITDSPGNTLTLERVDLASLDAGDFIF